MTLNDLIKQIPKEYHDSIILIDIPCIRPGDEGTYPLIQIMIDQVDNSPVRIILEADSD